MATFNYTVDTRPMADEMRTVSHHVDGTTVAVVAMQLAVVAAEEEAAELVCENVNKGFYTLIRSQISQKLAKLQSEVDSNLMQLLQQKNALLNIKTRMQRDYNMIATRYTKLFNGLNVNLKNRVFELDKPTIDFACREIDKVSNRTRYLTATVPVSQLESVSASQRIVASNVKQRGFNVIHSMKTFIHEMNVQKILTDQILINDNTMMKLGTNYIPIILIECNRGDTDLKTLDILVPDSVLDNITKSAIKNMAYGSASELKWTNDQSSKPEVSSEFSKLLSASVKAKKINEMTMKLYTSHHFQTLKG